MKPRKKNSSAIGAITHTNTEAATSAAVLLLTPRSLGSLSLSMKSQQARVDRGEDVEGDPGGENSRDRGAQAGPAKPEVTGAERTLHRGEVDRGGDESQIEQRHSR